MNRIAILVVATALAFGACSYSAFAQRAGGASSTGASNSTPMAPTLDSSTRQSQALSDYMYKAQQSNKTLTVGEQNKQLAEHKAASQALANALNLSCKVTDGVLASESKADVNGKTVTTKAYEVSCANAMGYFLVSHNPGTNSGFSCFSAEAQRLLDQAKGITNGLSCQLPANKDIKVLAGRVMAKIGTSCAVDKLLWMGQTKSVEYTEVACADGKGYLLDTPLVGHPGAIHVLSCADAATKGLTCKLTRVAAPPAPAHAALTLQTFKDALVQHGITCTASKERVMGQENVLKRYVVEFQCPQYPHGLVAFIPLRGNTAKFQVEDCAAAAKRHLMCKFTNAK